MATFPVFSVLLGLLLVFWSLGAYNRLTRLKQSLAQAYARLAHVTQMRDDAASALGEWIASAVPLELRQVETLLAAREQARLARASAGQRLHDPATVQALAAAQGVYTTSLRRITRAAEGSAALYAQALYHSLHDDLGAAEAAAAQAQRAYNGAADDYTEAIHQFPARLLALLFGFGPATPLETPEPSLSRRTLPAPLQ